MKPIVASLGLQTKSDYQEKNQKKDVLGWSGVGELPVEVAKFHLYVSLYHGTRSC